jgi:membrane protease YdiL (CAAX protease family)
MASGPRQGAAAMPPLPFSGGQLAVLLVFATVLGTAFAPGMAAALGLPEEDKFYLSQVLTMSIDAAALICIPALRRRTARLLHASVPRECVGEVAAVATVAVLMQFALFGSYALQHWFEGGDAAVATLGLDAARSVEAAFSAATLRSLAIACLAAPLLEEILFRGFLFEAWSAKRPAFLSMLFTSVLFGLLHPVFWAPVLVALLLNALYVRTGALRAAILVHFIANAALWNPLVPRLILPGRNVGLQSWWFHLACLAILPIVILIYAVVAARSRKPIETASGEPQAAS